MEGRMEGRSVLDMIPRNEISIIFVTAMQDIYQTQT